MVDFAAAWRDYLFSRPPESQRRLDPVADAAFWTAQARRYDAGHEDAGAAQTRAAIAALVGPEDTLLDAGAGTGRFALPLARMVRTVTALDFSPEMLAILAEKARAAGLPNVQTLRADLLEAALPPHDVVLAAWSLYRQVDLAATLERLVAATRRMLVVATGAGDHPPHRVLVKQIWGRDGEPDIPSYLYVAGALWQLGVLAEVRVVYETHLIARATPEEIARRFAPAGASGGDLAALAGGLAPVLERDGDGWRYTYRSPVGLVVWHRAAGTFTTVATAQPSSAADAAP